MKHKSYGVLVYQYVEDSDTGMPCQVDEFVRQRRAADPEDTVGENVTFGRVHIHHSEVDPLDVGTLCEILRQRASA